MIADLDQLEGSNQTELDGLNWLDEDNSNLPNWRKQSLQFYSSEYRRLP